VYRRSHADLRKIYLHLKAPRFDRNRQPHRPPEHAALHCLGSSTAKAPGGRRLFRAIDAILGEHRSTARASQGRNQRPSDRPSDSTRYLSARPAPLGSPRGNCHSDHVEIPFPCLQTAIKISLPQGRIRCPWRPGTIRAPPTCSCVQRRSAASAAPRAR
jgi:hypothetical protein